MGPCEYCGNCADCDDDYWAVWEEGESSGRSSGRDEGFEEGFRAAWRRAMEAALGVPEVGVVAQNAMTDAFDNYEFRP